ncbi:unnamed protein product, partial [Mesorhabditis spiculigera]
MMDVDAALSDIIQKQRDVKVSESATRAPRDSIKPRGEYKRRFNVSYRPRPFGYRPRYKNPTRVNLANLHNELFADYPHDGIIMHHDEMGRPVGTADIHFRHRPGVAAILISDNMGMMIDGQAIQFHLIGRRPVTVAFKSQVFIPLFSNRLLDSPSPDAAPYAYLQKQGSEVRPSSTRSLTPTWAGPRQHQQRRGPITNVSLVSLPHFDHSFLLSHNISASRVDFHRDKIYQDALESLKRLSANPQTECKATTSGPSTSAAPVGVSKAETSSEKPCVSEMQPVNASLLDAPTQPNLRDVDLVDYKDESQLAEIMELITKDLSEPYSIYTYRYFIHGWPELCILAVDRETRKLVGTVICKLDGGPYKRSKGYIAMLAVDQTYRRHGLGTRLVRRAIERMQEKQCDEVVLETEVTNTNAATLYSNLGFIREKRLFRYYLNGVDAFRLKLYFSPPPQTSPTISPDQMDEEDDDAMWLQAFTS